MRIVTLYLRNSAAARRAWARHSAGKPPLSFAHAMPDIHNTNPLAPTQLAIRVETWAGPRTIFTGMIDRKMASAIVDALAQNSVFAAVHDDLGTHTIADLVKRKRAREKRRGPVLVKHNADVIHMARRDKP